MTLSRSAIVATSTLDDAPASIRRAAKANQLPVDLIAEVRATEDLGPVLTAPYPVPGGTAQLYEPGIVVNRAGSEVVIEFGLPMIGWPG